MPITLLHILGLYFILIHENTIGNTTTINLKAETNQNRNNNSPNIGAFKIVDFICKKIKIGGFFIADPKIMCCRFLVILLMDKKYGGKICF